MDSQPAPSSVQRADPLDATHMPSGPSPSEPNSPMTVRLKRKRSASSNHFLNSHPDVSLYSSVPPRSDAATSLPGSSRVGAGTDTRPRRKAQAVSYAESDSDDDAAKITIRPSAAAATLTKSSSSSSSRMLHNGSSPSSSSHSLNPPKGPPAESKRTISQEEAASEVLSAAKRIAASMAVQTAGTSSGANGSVAAWQTVPLDKVDALGEARSGNGHVLSGKEPFTPPLAQATDDDESSRLSSISPSDESKGSGSRAVATPRGQSPGAGVALGGSLNGHATASAQSQASSPLQVRLNKSSSQTSQVSQSPQSKDVKYSNPLKAPAVTVKRHTALSSRDYAPLKDSEMDDNASARPANEGGMKRMDLGSKSKENESSEMARSSSVAGRSAGPPDPAQHPARKAQIRPAASIPLQSPDDDANTSNFIPTYLSTPRNPAPRTRSRLFGLQDCPTFYPTPEEFADPIKYISWVANPEGGHGVEYGIVKVVPPIDWHMEFVLDQAAFRFRTRSQKLNELSAETRAAENYEGQLEKFHSQQGRRRLTRPVIDRRAVNLYQLKLITKKLGGPDQVSKTRKWADVARHLGYPDEEAGRLAAQVKAAHAKIIQPFEDFMVQAREQVKSKAASSLGPASPEQEDPTHSTSLGVGEETGKDHKRRSHRARAETITRKAGLSGASGSRKSRSRYEAQDDSNVVTLSDAEDSMCEICLSGDEGTSMLLCDECDKGYHMFCLTPQLTSVPKSEWYCPACLVGTGNDFGFLDGETHSLESFHKRADAFRRAWFKDLHPEAVWKGDGPNAAENGVARTIPGTTLRVTEDDVEREFWRLVHDPLEEVDVEYGADVHSSTHRSACPTPETHPLSSYARDGWNLNNLPILPGSLLRYIRSNISGMTAPWLYVGMMFSTFCWHNEDHYTYSINYQHWGDTKTWYGVPGADAEKFEQAMRAAAPDLFETSPDLLFQLVTMMSPQTLKEAGVRVYACDQRANEMVITFPKAYHSGFNQGFNLNEAVNFALPDWLPYDLESVKRLQAYARPPVFSHDELIITASQHSTSIETASWLARPFAEMVKREMSSRAQLRELVPGIREVVLEEELTEAQYQCAHCKCLSYLSRITSPKAEGAVACLEHGFSVCGADSPSEWTMTLRFADEHLKSSFEKIKEKAKQPQLWLKRRYELMVSEARPPLRALRALLAEGEKVASHLSEVVDLREFVTRANEVVEEALKILPRRHASRPAAVANGRRRRSALISESPSGAQNGDDSFGSKGETRCSLGAFQSLLREADQLAFDSPETAMLREIAVIVEEVQKSSRELLAREEAGSRIPIDEFEQALAAGADLSVEVPEFAVLETRFKSIKWSQEMDDIATSFLSLSEVQALLEEFEETDLDQSNAHHVSLKARLEEGLEWQQMASQIIDGKVSYTIADLQRLTTTPDSVPIVREMQADLELLLKNGKDWQDGLNSLVSASSRASLAAEEAYKQARKLVKGIGETRLALDFKDDIIEAVKQHDDWQSMVGEQLVWVLSPEAQEADVSSIINDFVIRVRRCTSRADDCPLPDLVPQSHPPQCFERLPYDDVVAAAGSGMIRCSQCACHYHHSCVGVREADIPRLIASGLWKCPLCNPAALPGTLQNRRAVSADLIKSLAEPVTFKPDCWDSINEAQSHLAPFQARTRAFLADKPDVHMVANVKQYHHILQRLIGLPVDIFTDDGQSMIHVCVQALFTFHSLDATGKPNRPTPSMSPKAIEPARASLSARQPPPQSPTQQASQKSTVQIATPSSQQGLQTTVTGSPSSSAPLDTQGADSSAQQGADAKRKRGKRAKLIFREEVNIWVPVNGQRIFCLCHQKESNTMINCDRCMQWFHTKCVFVDEAADLDAQKWHCPLCCVKTERKYPFAEVKVKEKGITDPELWLDIRTSLRSARHPVSKRQMWTAPPDRRIVLHLESFCPAIQAPDRVADRPQKRRKQWETEGQDASYASDQAVAGSYESASVSTPKVEHADRSVGAKASEVAIRPQAGVEAQPSQQSAMMQSQQQPMITSRQSLSSAGPAAAAGLPLPSPLQPRAPARSEQTIPAARPLAPPPSVPSQSEAAYSSGTGNREADIAAEAEMRHAVGMRNLYDRGVTGPMIDRYLIGWTGFTLVWPNFDPSKPNMRLELGPYIRLAPEDPDGTFFLRKTHEKYRRWVSKHSDCAVRPFHSGHCYVPVGPLNTGPSFPPWVRDPLAQDQRRQETEWAASQASLHRAHQGQMPEPQMPASSSLRARGSISSAPGHTASAGSALPSMAPASLPTPRRTISGSGQSSATHHRQPSLERAALEEQSHYRNSQYERPRQRVPSGSNTDHGYQHHLSSSYDLGHGHSRGLGSVGASPHQERWSSGSHSGDSRREPVNRSPLPSPSIAQSHRPSAMMPSSQHSPALHHRRSPSIMPIGGPPGPPSPASLSFVSEQDRDRDRRRIVLSPESEAQYHRLRNLEREEEEHQRREHGRRQAEERSYSAQPPAYAVERTWSNTPTPVLPPAMSHSSGTAPPSLPPVSGSHTDRSARTTPVSNSATTPTSTNGPLGASAASVQSADAAPTTAPSTAKDSTIASTTAQEAAFERMAFRRMAKKMQPGATEEELEVMVDRIMRDA